MAVNFMAGHWLLTAAGTPNSIWDGIEVPERSNGSRARLDKAKAMEKCQDKTANSNTKS